MPPRAAWCRIFGNGLATSRGNLPINGRVKVAPLDCRAATGSARGRWSRRRAAAGGADASGAAGTALGSGGQTRVARPLAARCSTIGGGRSNFGDLVTGGARPSGCTSGRDTRVHEAVRLRAASDPRVRCGGAGASAPRGVPRALQGAGGAAAGVRDGGALGLRGPRGLRASTAAKTMARSPDPDSKLPGYISTGQAQGHR